MMPYEIFDRKGDIESEMEALKAKRDKTDPKFAERSRMIEIMRKKREPIFCVHGFIARRCK